MKRYLLFIISMLCVSIGTWAQETSGTLGTGGSEWSLDDGVLTLTVRNANDLTSVWTPVCSLEGVNRVKLVTDGVTLGGGAWETPMRAFNTIYKTVPVADLSEASLSYSSKWDGTFALAMGDGSTFSNVIVPTAYRGNPENFVICNAYNVNDAYTFNRYTVPDAKTVVGLFYPGVALTALSNISPTATTLKINNEVGAIDLTSVITSEMVSALSPNYYTIDLTLITTEWNENNAITVSNGVKAICTSTDVMNRVKGTADGNVKVDDPNISCDASGLDAALSPLTTDGIAPTSITLTGGTIDAEVLNKLNIPGLKKIDLKDATMASEVDVNDITLPTTLQVLVLPKGSVVSDGLKTKAIANNNLNYIYSPTNVTQDESQSVADYVWVNKPGGLANAFDDQEGLRNARYMKVVSTVALNETDVDFKGPGAGRTMQYLYLDLSDANLTPAMLAQYKVTDDLPYRIILPNDWTGDMMAVFAANPYKGSIAAVYSYTGTDHKRLDILELNDYAYLPTALNDSRIVRSGTTSIRVVSGHYGNNPVYSKFGDNLLTAINGAASSITSVTIAVGSGIYESVDTNSDDKDDTDLTITGAKTFAFTNTNLTNLTMNYVNNGNLTVDVSGCTSLQSLYLNETTLAGVNASGCSNLTTASLGHAIVGDDVVGGDVNLSGTKLTSLLEVDKAEIKGTLNVSNTQAREFDFTQLTAKSVDAKNISTLEFINIDGIKLNGMTTGSETISEPNRENEIGTINVTGSIIAFGEYGVTTIQTKSGFDKNRIIPNLDEQAAASGECAEQGYLWEDAYSKWIANNYTTYKLSDEALEAKKTEEGYEGTLEAWISEKIGYGAYDDIVNVDDARNAFAIQPEAFFSQTYTNDGFINTTTATEDYNAYKANETTSAKYNEYIDKEYQKYVNEEESPMSKADWLLDSGLGGSLPNYDTWKDDPAVNGVNSYDKWLSEHYADKDGGSWKYLTSTATDAWDASLKNTPKQVCAPTYQISELAPTADEITVAGPGIEEKIEALGETAASTVKILHVTETLTEADADFISTMKGLKTLDLSEATYDAGVSYTNILSAGLHTSTAIILPGKNNTESGMAEAMYNFQSNGYECVGYYTRKTETDQDLNVYGYNASVENLLTGNLSTLQPSVTQPRLVDAMTDLHFLPKYSSAAGAFGEYPSATPSLLSSLSTLKGDQDAHFPFTVDLTWLNISNLSNDFSAVYCRHLIIPQNSSAATVTRNDKLYNNDFTVENDGKASTVEYKYNDEVYAVSTYKGKVAPYATNAYFAGKAIMFEDNEYGGINKTGNLTYVRQADRLYEIASHTSALLKNADVVMIAGTLTNNENTYNGLAAFENSQMDLTHATLGTGFDWESFDNDNIEYLALPDGQNAAINATSADVFAFSGCEKLKAVGAYDPVNTKYTVHSTALTAPSAPSAEGQENSVYVISSMCCPNTNRYPGNTIGTTNVVMSGYLTAADINAYEAKVTVGDKERNQAGLASSNNCTIQEGDFTNAVFLNNEDLSFTGAAWQVTRVTSIKLPTDSRQTLIPADCLNNFGNITEMCIPRNITTIGDRAFYGARSLHHVTTTDEDGNEIDNGDKTYTFAPTLESIGTGAFVAYKLITDVYVLATTAPRCAKDAFDVGSYVSNNTFAGVQAHPFARDKYIMNSDKGDMAILHFPSNISITEAEKYTDLTRDYSLIDETGVVDGEGRPIAWPNQSEYLRAYDQAVTGVTWDAWDKTRDAQNSIEWGTYNTSTPGLNLDSSHGYDTDYMGWHQFVLCASWASHIVEPTEETVEYVSTGWNTICLPYNMTRAQLIKYLGVPASVTSGDNIVYNKVGEEQIDEDKLPEIRTMIGVTRTKEVGTVKNKITIHLSLNLSTQPKDITVGLRGATYTADRTDQSGSTSADAKDLIYLKGGYPYFIKAYLPKSIKENMGSLSLGALTTMRITRSADAGLILGQTGYQEEVDVTNGTSVIKQETVNKPKEIKVQAVYQEGESVYFAKSDDTVDNTEAEDENDFIYSFEGQYWEQYLPLGCYYLGSGNKFYRATAKLNGNSDTWSKWTWKPYVAVVTPKVVVEEKNPIYLGEGKGYFQGYSVSYKAGDDSFADAQWARSVEMAFDEDIIEVGDDKATDIDVLNGVRIAPVTGKVYNMNGQLIGNSLEGLPKGMYIVNGKKIVVN